MKPIMKLTILNLLHIPIQCQLMMTMTQTLRKLQMSDQEEIPTLTVFNQQLKILRYWITLNLLSRYMRIKQMIMTIKLYIIQVEYNISVVR